MQPATEVHDRRILNTTSGPWSNLEPADILKQPPGPIPRLDKLCGRNNLNGAISYARHCRPNCNVQRLAHKHGSISRLLAKARQNRY
jgi:hypothetical protein